MLSLTFGLIAALCWGLHDFIIRILRQPRGIYASIAAVLFFGCLFQTPVIVLNADFSKMPLLALWVSVLSGSSFAKRIYRADEVLADAKIRNQLKEWETAGYGELPVCMAKTQYSFTTDPNLRGAPTGHSLPIREVRLSAGAGFVIVICGEIMTMPGLPSKPASENIMLNETGQIEGLF